MWVVTFTPRLLCPAEAPLLPFRKDAEWAPEPIWTPWRRKRPYPCLESSAWWARKLGTTLTELPRSVDHLRLAKYPCEFKECYYIPVIKTYTLRWTCFVWNEQGTFQETLCDGAPQFVHVPLLQVVMTFKGTFRLVDWTGLDWVLR